MLRRGLVPEIRDSAGDDRALIALAIPLLDTALAIARRFLRRQPVFGADRGHIHHRLLTRGFTPRRVAYILYASAGIVAGLSLLLSSGVKHTGGIALVAFCMVVWLAIQYLGYEEFDAARHMIFGGIFRRTLNANLSISQLELAVKVARSVDDCWSALVETSRGFGFSEASLEFGELRLTARLAEAPGPFRPGVLAHSPSFQAASGEHRPIRDFSGKGLRRQTGGVAG